MPPAQNVAMAVLLAFAILGPGCISPFENPLGTNTEGDAPEQGEGMGPPSGSAYRRHGTREDPWEDAPLVAVLSVEISGDMGNVTVVPGNVTGGSTFVNATYDLDTTTERVRLQGPLRPPANGTHVLVLFSENGATSAWMGYNDTENGFHVELGGERMLLVAISPRLAHLAAFPTDRPRTIESASQDGGSGVWAVSLFQPDTMRMHFPEDDLEIQVSFLGIWPRENVTVPRT